jgi:hypothetical protein
MDSQQEKPSPSPDRLTFFGLPASWHLWARVGATFWGGVLAGLGIGLLVARVLAELEVQRTVWVGVIGIVLAGLGPVIAFRAVRGSWQPDKGKPQNP